MADKGKTKVTHTKLAGRAGKVERVIKTAGGRTQVSEISERQARREGFKG